MGGSRRIARLAFIWGLIATSGAVIAAAQETATSKPVSRAQSLSIPQSATSSDQTFRISSPGLPTSQRPSAQRAGPWLPQPWQPVRADTPNRDASLGDNHTIVISTLGLIIIGAIILILVL